MEDVNEDPLLLSDDEIVGDNINSMDREPLGEDKEVAPEVGMIFDGEKELFDFYKRYAYAVDFPVRKRNSKKGDDGVVRYITFTCSREDNVGKWKINTVHLKHNHKTSSSKSRLFRCNRELTANAKRKLELNDMAGISLHKSYNSTVVEADNRSRQAYKEFGDIVTFDTTYLTNKYDMPSAPFVGVNHHGQSILLGCGLLSNEDTGTFVWLFKTWLKCMYGHPPHGIITDQDKAMQNAIEIVFLNTKHR
ncbi:uncharacterized protein LOC111391106 [Olea europaea var. sylvestris]|uniref:uncharacterized protein LOC111391106 n=1 Tax=Olea europaea var. sylvestris TaxID=158386 RepID=UPI000C1D2789|nr:uncharacterized protein LOC111391106 [Olea europaea var. sylvestris]